MKFTDRLPVIALDYDKRDLRVGNELLIDYTNGSIYITKKDREIIDMSDRISKQIKDFPGDNVQIIINTTGTMTLKECLTVLLKNKITIKRGVPKPMHKDMKLLAYNDIKLLEYTDDSNLII